MSMSARLLAGGAVLAWAMGPASAADEVVAEQPLAASDWIVQVTPYLWAAGMEGDVSPFRAGPTLHVDMPFSEIFENLNFGGFLNVLARRDRWVFSGDLMYVNVSGAEAIGPFPILPEVVLDAEVKSIQFHASGLAGYRVVDTPTFNLDLLAGGRFWDVSNEVTLTLENVGSRSHKEDFNWFDPLIGARALVALSERISVLGQADIGGFGVGSDLTWSVLGTVNYTFNDHWSASVGYKHMSVDR